MIQRYNYAKQLGIINSELLTRKLIINSLQGFARKKLFLSPYDCPFNKAKGYVLKNTAFLKGLPIGFITPHRGEIAMVGLVLECKAPR